MKTKTLILSLIIAVSPFFALADNSSSTKSSKISAPKVLEIVPPRVSDFHYGSEVVLEFTVEADGSVSNIRPIQHYWKIELIEVASKTETALSQWRFRPATDASGNAVPTRVRMPVVVSSEGISYEGSRVMDSAIVAQSEGEYASDEAEG
ncbi:MAG: hypothetical protein AB3N63_04460 [Puniceicoccaceae bacterium]